MAPALLLLLTPITLTDRRTVGAVACGFASRRSSKGASGGEIEGLASRAADGGHQPRSGRTPRPEQRGEDDDLQDGAGPDILPALCLKCVGLPDAHVEVARKNTELAVLFVFMHTAQVQKLLLPRIALCNPRP